MEMLFKCDSLTCDPTPGIVPLHVTWAVVYGAGTAIPIRQLVTPLLVTGVLKVTLMTPVFAELTTAFEFTPHASLITNNYLNIVLCLLSYSFKKLQTHFL